MDLREVSLDITNYLKAYKENGFERSLPRYQKLFEGLQGDMDIFG